jgi:hypothetical protein
MPDPSRGMDEQVEAGWRAARKLLPASGIAMVHDATVKEVVEAVLRSLPGSEARLAELLRAAVEGRPGWKLDARAALADRLDRAPTGTRPTREQIALALYEHDRERWGFSRTWAEQSTGSVRSYLARADAVLALSPSEPCGRIMVGSGTDTYDPVCELPEGHRGSCKSSAATDQHRLSDCSHDERGEA